MHIHWCSRQQEQLRVISQRVKLVTPVRIVKHIDDVVETVEHFLSVHELS